MRRRIAAGAAGLLALGGGLTACGSPSAAPAARAYLSAWSNGDLAAAGRDTDNPAAAQKALAALRTSLAADAVHATVGKVSAHGSTATATFTAQVHVAGLGVWSYPGRLTLQRSGGHWRVHWTVQDIHPALTASTHLARVRTLPPRAPIVDDNGTPLFTSQPVVNVGIEPSRLKGHEAQTLAAVGRVLGVDTAGLKAAVDAARPDEFVPVITLRRAAYEQVKPRIYSLPGTVFTTGTLMLPPTTGFARPLLGTVGPATADVLKAAGPDYLPGDTLGLSGLQLTFQRRLAGTASGSVVLAAADGHTVRTLATFHGRPPRPVQVTLDRLVQQAAEDALAHESKPAALVAIDPTDGHILAAASTPDATSFDRALDGRYPPGSTFKVVTTYALLGVGVRPSTRVPCAPSVTVDGKPFHNFEHEANGSATFSDDFAQSCNTAFVTASQRLGDTALHDAATSFGIGAKWTLPVPSFSGSVPPPADQVEKVADAIGQGRVEVSPLDLALVAAAVDAGRVTAPQLLLPAHATAATPLDPARVATLRALMGLVVTSGTAAGAGLPAGTVGKTGTAEFGTGTPPATHAWFLGYRGRVAFAVLVEGGGVGGSVAAPLAAAFLRRLG